MNKVMLIYPSGEQYQRGEDRCQINVEASVSNSLRACNDLGYAASILRNSGYEVFLRDYPAENLTYNDFEADFKNENPDAVFISTTNGSIFSDIEFVEKIKNMKPNIVVILKSALFFNPDENLFSEINLENIDYLIGGETEFIIKPLLEAHYKNKENLSLIEGICYKNNGKWIVNKLTAFNENIDKIPFPARDLMRNELYINPQTNRPMATIATSRGCPSNCIYCVSPLISGKKVRFRSVKSVYEEINECYNRFQIKDFFFKSDTFTINKQWVIELCDCILSSPLKGRINWVANSRVNTIDDEMLKKMKMAGCSVIALGLESGSEESLKLMKKGTTLEQNKTAVKLIKKNKLQIFGFYLIGFPWENKKHLDLTKKLIFDLDTDFIEISIAVPFKGSELYNMVYLGTSSEKNDKGIVEGRDSFKNTALCTEFLTNEELNKFRKDIILKYHLRPSYILKKIFNKNLTFDLFRNYIKYGIRLIKNVL